jgi:beta-lactamase class C
MLHAADVMSLRFICILVMAFQVCLIAETPLNQEAQARLIDGVILQFMQKNDIPGVAISLYDGDEGYTLCYGVANKETQAPITPDTIFEIASITKVFTTTDLALHVENGTLSLNDPLAQYLPAIYKNKGAIGNVTLLQLATHTSSLPRSPPPLQKGKRYTRHEVIEFLQNWQPEYPVGTHYLYSNLGVGLIGYALENVEHKSFEPLLKDDIFKPLGMNSTLINVPYALMNKYAQGYSPQGRPTRKWSKSVWPAGGALRSTPADMLKFLEANLGVGVSQSLQKAIQIAQKGYYKVNDHLTMGLAWQRVETKGLLLIDKNGGVPGFSSYIGMIPEKKIGIVILANKSKAECTKIGRLLLLRLAKASH